MKKRIAIKINPTPESNNRVEVISDSSLAELNKYLEEGYTIERETVLPSSTAVSNNVYGYKGLAAVIYILVKEE